MARLSFFADEHVPGVVVTALRSNGYVVDLARERFGERTSDRVLVEESSSRGQVLLTNDRDFVVLGDEIDHGGIVVYTTQTLSPGRFVRGIDRIDDHLGDGMENDVEWLEAWLD